MLILNINGPINSGKSTIAKLLVNTLSKALFIEVDDLVSDEEKVRLNLSDKQGWQERIKRLDNAISKLKQDRAYENIIFAYPMTREYYSLWKEYEDKYTKFLNITLSPSLEVCLKNRKDRELSLWEINRIKQMYNEGYHCPENSDLIICNDKQTPSETLEIIKDFLKNK